MAEFAASSPRTLLTALGQPETPYSLAYRLGWEVETCQRWLEALVSQGEVVRLGADGSVVYAPARTPASH